MQTLEEIGAEIATDYRRVLASSDQASLAADIVAALRAERERCAKVADERAEHFLALLDEGKGTGEVSYVRDAEWTSWLGHRAEAEHIAAAIRNQP